MLHNRLVQPLQRAEKLPRQQLGHFFAYRRRGRNGKELFGLVVPQAANTAQVLHRHGAGVIIHNGFEELFFAQQFAVLRHFVQPQQHIRRIGHRARAEVDKHRVQLFVD